jgi:hypothetical protein
MKVINMIPSFGKIDASTRRGIYTGIKRLKERIETYIQYNGSFDNIGMDDKLIHDAYVSNGKRFFLFKCRIKSMSLRLLYTLENDDIVIISYVCKKDSRYEYFDFFENACDEYMYEHHQNMSVVLERA